ncbi:hypothetical protein PIB30_016309 [Stylosanthes scabra]|uniref:Uncharacterized protein n=1 Tax=Stylosanthes scabra TaxID=79078 RepID=A0ABU6R7I6_9FABA|nr:hypothetical protein [Stylosanthes scabra]
MMHTHQRPTLKTAGFKLDYIPNAFSFKVGNVEEVYHPKKPPAVNKKFAHQVQLSKEDKDERRQSEEAKTRLKRGKGLRSSPPHMKKKKKDPTKKKVKIRKQGEDSSKEEKEEEKEKRKLELKRKSVEDLIGKLYTFKKVLHHNDAMNHHLVKSQSKWKGNGAAARHGIANSARWPWRARAVSLATFDRSYTSVWRVRALFLARPHGRASARWPWCVRALALGALGSTTGRAARPRPSDRAPARAH